MCDHNERARYTHGFYCEQCHTFFGVKTPTYRRGELLSSIWMVLHNINVDRYRAGKPTDEEVQSMKDKIGIGIDHKNYEQLITEAEKIMSRYGKHSDSASMTLDEA